MAECGFLLRLDGETKELFTGMVKLGVLVRAGLETNSENSAFISAEFSDLISS